MNVSNSTGVESSNSVRRPKSKDTKSEDRVLKNTNDMTICDMFGRSQYCYYRSNKRETMHSESIQSNASVLNTKTVNAINDGSNIVSVSYGKDVFLLSHEKCVARYALSRDSKVIQLVLWIIDSGCSKHMTGNLSLLRNFIEKFMGTVCFGNDHFATITGYGDYGDDLLTGSRDSNLYTISISELAASSPVCLMSKATSTKSWLWHRRISHLNFACEQGKSKKASLTPKLVPSTQSKLELLQMDLCGPMRVASINGKKYILNRSIVHTRYNKTPYELIHGRKPNVQYFYVFGSLCYPTNNHDDLGKVKPKADIEVSDNSTTNTLDNKDTSSSSSIVIEEDEAPQKVSSSAEQVVSEPNTSFLNDNVDELV
ncbi:retrovirus-related pol polyprotein from transposon TNT 1-94 [Tanacetum coccineum]